MGACQNEFHNVPQLQIQSQSLQQHERQREKQRFTSKSISLPHKTLKPNLKQIKIGMIESNNNHLTANRQTVPVGYNTTKYRTQYLSRRLTYNDHVKSEDSSLSLQAQSDIKSANQQIDREQLHQTMRPFDMQQYVAVPNQPTQANRIQEKQHKELTLDFYHSLGLPQYTYPPIPEPYFSNEYKSGIQMHQQQQRNGVRYIGQWKQSHIHGNGVLKSNTVKYIGQFRNGLKNFHGRQIQAQQIYQGGFWAGRRKGQGVLYTPTQVQQGQFDQHLIAGKITYQNGDIYEGQLQNHLYHGKGRLSQNNNQIICEGQYKYDKMHGLGSIKYSDGKAYNGLFEDGLKHGFGKFIWDEKNEYEGEYMKGKKHGKGKLLRNETIYDGTFKNGTMNGKMCVYNMRGQTKVNERYQQYQNGMKINNNEDSYMSESQDLPENWRNAVLRNSADE